MSKKLRNLLAVFVAALTALAVTPAFAAWSTDVTGSTVTVKNIKAGDQLYLYKVADATLGDDNVVSYTMASNLPEAYDTAAELQAITSDNYKYNADGDAKAAADALAVALSNGTAAYGPATADAGGTATISNVAPGYYVGVVKAASANSASKVVYQNMLIDTTPTASTGTSWTKTNPTLNVKKTDETVTKTATDPTTQQQVTTTDGYKRGDWIPFTITTTMPNYPSNSTHATFVIGDNPTGITLPETTDTTHGYTVSVGSEANVAAGETTYIITVVNNKLTITFAKDYILSHTNQSVVVKYSGQLTAKTSTGDIADGKAVNSATITYNPNPYEDTTNETDPHVDVKTYGYVFDKVNDATTPAALENATFTLYNEDGTAAITDENGDNVTSTSTLAGPTGSQKAYVYFSGLAAGTYTVKETTVPAGYNAVEDFKITVNSDTATSDNPATTDVTESNYVVKSNSVIDTTGTRLPTTGGMGTTIFTVVGATLVVAAGALLVTRKRMEK